MPVAALVSCVVFLLSMIDRIWAHSDTTAKADLSLAKSSSKLPIELYNSGNRASFLRGARIVLAARGLTVDLEAEDDLAEAEIPAGKHRVFVFSWPGTGDRSQLDPVQERQKEALLAGQWDLQVQVFEHGQSEQTDVDGSSTEEFLDFVLDAYRFSDDPADDASPLPTAAATEGGGP